jgi:ribosomal protein S18 acetylase RimI-like enzyme
MSLLDRLPPRIVMVARLPGASSVQRDDGIPIRNVTPNDLPALAELLVVAYAGTIDDLGQTPAEALEELEQHTIGGAVGEPLWDCSLVAVDAGTPVAVVLTTNEDSHPLFAYVYTHPDFQRRGMATSLLQRCMKALHKRGFDHVRLRVALANERARRVYERLGFAEE